MTSDPLSPALSDCRICKTHRVQEQAAAGSMDNFQCRMHLGSICLPHKWQPLQITISIMNLRIYAADLIRFASQAGPQNGRPVDVQLLSCCRNCSILLSPSPRIMSPRQIAHAGLLHITSPASIMSLHLCIAALLLAC